jgi:peptide deformylase
VVEASGLEARVIQHEIDHLDGVLILDRTSRAQRRDAMRALRERADAEQAA